MKHFFLIFSLFSLSSLSNALFAQSNCTIMVKDSASGESLIGATVLEKGKQNGSLTDLDGKVVLPIATSGKITFTVEYVGYNTKNMVIDMPQTEAFTTVLLAQNEAELEMVTVSAVRTNSRIEDIPTRIEVLGLDDLNEENGVKPGNIMSLLGDIAGIQMQQVSASSGNTLARVQGLNGRYTQILKDGIPLFGGLSGGFGIMQIPPLDLKQIEIIKGSVSTLYGGDAIGGIINLVSKEPTTDAELALTLNQSSLLETNLNAYYSKKFKKIGFTFFAGQTLQAAVDVDKDGLSDSPNVNSTVIHPKLVLYLNPKSTLTFNYTGTFDQRKGGNMAYFQKNASDTLYHIYNDMKRHSFDAKYIQNFTPNQRLTLKAAFNNTRQYINTKPYIFYAEQNIVYSEASFFTKYKKTDWVAGINYNIDAFKINGVLPNIPLIDTTYGSVPRYDYTTFGVFAQNTWNVSQKFVLESGLRSDFHSTFGTFLLPRLSLMYKANQQFTARLNGGYGYKTPNTVNYINTETDVNNLAPTIGNGLLPELSQGMNGDVNYENAFFKKLRVTLNQSFFFTNLSRPIIDKTNYRNQITLQNASDALQTQGLQTYARLRYLHTELYLGYVFTDVTKRYDAAQPTPYVTPKHNFSTTFFYEPSEAWRFGIESSLIAGQLDQNYAPVKDYFLFASMIQYNIGKFSLVLNGENLLDFRQNAFGKIYTGGTSRPVFQKLWSPIDGRVVNLSIKYKL
jgi:outer membrane receptor for ferrienterochelin and colicins